MISKPKQEEEKIGEITDGINKMGLKTEVFEDGEYEATLMLMSLDGLHLKVKELREQLEGFKY